MRVLMSSMCLPGAPDGASLTSWSLLCALRRLGVCASLCTSDFGRGIPTNGDPDIHVFPQTIARPIDLSTGVQRFLWEQIRRASVCHFFAFYSTATVWGAHVARRHGVPYVISPIGNMIPAFGRAERTTLKAINKRLYFELLAKSVLNRAAFIVCATGIEKDRIERYAPGARCVIVPHGREPSADSGGGRAVTLPEHSRLALFLGRFSPEKSLPFLLDVWADVRRRVRGALLVIAGDDRLCPGYERMLRAKVAELNMEDAVCFTGAVDKHQREWLFERCSCLVLPSTNENFGHVVVEALNAGRPAITSTGTTWRGLPEAGVGCWLPLDRTVWADCLSEYMSADSPAAQPGLAKRRRNWLSQNIPTWDEAAEAHVRFYREAMHNRQPGQRAEAK